MELNEILQVYTNDILPKMLDQNFHLTLVKGGRNYPHLPEQSHFAHIINGVFGLSRLLNYLQQQNIYAIDERQYRRVLSLYTTHDLHKTEAKIGTSEFAIALEDIQQVKHALGLDQFAETTAEEHRAANVHFRSGHKGDFLAFGDLREWTLVRIADSMASMTRAGDADGLGTLERYLSDLCPELALNYRFYYDELNDVRGVLTNLLHTLIGKTLQQELGLFPLMFFAAGVVYLGPKKLGNFNRNEYINTLSKSLLTEGLSSVRAVDQAKEGMRTQKYDFQSYVYLFADIETLLQVTAEFAWNVKPDVKFAEKAVDDFFKKKQTAFADSQDFMQKLGISLEEPKEFLQLWFKVNRYLLVVDSLVRDLITKDDRLAWFINAFGLPAKLHDPLNNATPIFLRGGLGKYVFVVGYHFLKGENFLSRSAIQMAPEDVMDILGQRVLAAFQRHDLSAARQVVAQDLKIEEDLENYLQENLIFSWQPQVQLLSDGFETYSKPKKKKTSNICTLCSRDSSANMPMREGVFGDFVQGFSNRNLPRKIQSDNMSWCPTCYLEFMLRSIARLALPSGADKASSKRLYLYVLPTYFFTPEHTLWLNKVLKPFKQLTRLEVRSYGKDQPGHPRIWLEDRTFDADLIGKLLKGFERETERLEQIRQQIGKEPVGDRLLTTALNQTNYMLFIWEKAAYGSSEDAQIPTRSEMWAKAVFAAAMIAGLTSCKVIVTEKPYLPVVDLSTLKSTLILDAPHNILRGILPDRTGAISLVDVCKLLDLGSALWQINSDVSRNTKDKHVAARLELVTTEPLAGACFYKEFARVNEEKSPYDLYTLACQVLLDHLGGTKMELAKQLAEKSMELYLPYRRSAKQQRGKARTYELIFREAADEFKAIYKQVIAGHAGQSITPESLAEVKTLLCGRLLKALERRQESKRGDGKVNPWRKDLKFLVQEFIDLLVDQLFIGRSHGSFTEFNQMINSMADGIFFVTDVNLQNKWEQYHERVEAWKQANAAKSVE